VVPACDGPAQALPQCIEGELALVRRASAARKSRLRSASPDPRGWSRVVPACDGPAQCVESRVSPLPALSSLPAPCVSPPPNAGPGSAAAPPRPRASSRFPRPSLPAPSPDTPRASPGCLCRLALPPLAPWGELWSMPSDHEQHVVQKCFGTTNFEAHRGGRLKALQRWRRAAAAVQPAEQRREP